MNPGQYCPTVGHDSLLRMRKLRPCSTMLISEVHIPSKTLTFSKKKKKKDFIKPAQVCRFI